MIYGLYQSAAGMQTQQYRLDVIANNMANVTTTGFKRDVALFQARPPESQTAPNGLRYRNPLLDSLGGGILASPTATEFIPGEVETTGNPLNVYIKGRGMFAVRDLDGQVRYTRDGRLTINDDGLLTMLDGQRLILDAEGQPIQLDPTRSVTISSDGVIAQDGSVAAQLRVTEFESFAGLRKVGAGLYAADQDARRAGRVADLVPQALERSTVEPVAELVGMIEAQRAYEANAQMIRIHDETLGRVINDLPRNL